MRTLTWRCSAIQFICADGSLTPPSTVGTAPSGGEWPRLERAPLRFGAGTKRIVVVREARHDIERYSLVLQVFRSLLNGRTFDRPNARHPYIHQLNQLGSSIGIPVQRLVSGVETVHQTLQRFVR